MAELARLVRNTDIVLLGEQRVYHRAAIATARPLGIAVTVTDFGYIRPDWVIVERNGMNAESEFPRDAAAILALAQGLPPVDRCVTPTGSRTRRWT
jgi:capsular polysaccharide export protein